MDFDYTDKVRALQIRTREFMERHVAPANAAYLHDVERGIYPSRVVNPLKAEARGANLWNMFLPGLRDDEPGMRLTNLEYAPLAEIMGRIPWAAEVFNCSAPDSGNMELLHLFATHAQRDRWLLPLMRGEMRSCFAMTEPDVASSDATNIRTTIRRSGGEFIINGRKWFASGAMHPQCKVIIVMGVSDDRPDAPSHSKHSMVLVPIDAPGLKIVRNLPIMHHYAPEGHCELLFGDVRVPADHLIGDEGRGFELAQARLGPGRVHHCMRTIGQCELALELMCARALDRRSFGRHLSEFANVQDWIAQSRVEIDQARLLVLQAAWMMDRQGNASARVAVSAIKVVAAMLQTRVVDRAMQVFGAMGLTSDTPLAYLWTWGRALRFIDGPDEVHLRTIARAEIGKAKVRREVKAS
jgi:acyl-CoA dehydrogenase